MIALRASLLFALLFYGGTVMFVLAAIAASLIGQRYTLAVILGWMRMHRWLTRNLLDIDTRVEGEIPQGAYLIAVKHQSMFETIETVRLAKLPVIVMKQELVQIPLFGLVTRRYGVIPVERSAGAKALRLMVAEGKAAVASGRPVIIYPEGTRVPVGARRPLRPGFAGLYRALGLPVVPVAVDSGHLWGRGLIKRPGTITFKVGSVIPAGLGRAEVEARVHEAINALD